MLPCVEQRELYLSQKSVLRLGPTKFDTDSSMHTVCKSAFWGGGGAERGWIELCCVHPPLDQDSIEQVVRVLASKHFTAVQTASGKVTSLGADL